MLSPAAASRDIRLGVAKPAFPRAWSWLHAWDSSTALGRDAVAGALQNTVHTTDEDDDKCLNDILRKECKTRAVFA